jgi:hypothetical protein
MCRELNFGDAFEIPGYQGGEFEDVSLLWHCAVLSGTHHLDNGGSKHL